MKKIILMVVFSLVSFLLVKTNIYAAVKSVCNYSYSNGSKSYRAIVKIKDNGDVKDTKITDRDENSNMAPTNDEEILNWYNKKEVQVDLSFWRIQLFDFSYTGKEKYLINKECLGYLVYVYTGTKIGYHLFIYETKADAEQAIGVFGEYFTSEKRIIEILPLEVIQPNNPDTGATSGGATSGGTTSGGTTSGGTTSGGATSGGATSGGSTSSGATNQDVKDDCEGIFGKNSETKKLLQKVLNIFRILAPILTLIFSSMDFLKAVAAGAKDDLKAAGTKLLKRLIVVALLFFVPTIINILLDIIENSNGTCGIN